MTDISIVGPDGGEQTLRGPVRMRILEDGRTTAHRLGIGEITIPPRTDGPPQHRHGRHGQGFCVVSGTVRYPAHDAAPGTLVMVPPGAPHPFSNPGDEPAALLNTVTPDLYVQYFRDLRDVIAAGQPPTGDAVVSLMARCDTVSATGFAS
jgi:mannose-6-phosphate isomerase-like protein (cupin superfamily)